MPETYRRWGNEVVYHVFVDRFRSGNPGLDVQDGEFTFRGKPVGSSTDRRRLTGDQSHQHTFYNGDLAGIRASLPYLAELGVTVLLLSPIFKSRSTHRYDTDDYFSLDPHVGTEADWQGLLADLRSRGMKIALDGVFGHTSFEHPWYRDPTVRARTYRLKPDGSPETWLDWGVMPKLETDEPAVQERLLAVIDRWPGVDAWRLDAAQHLPASFLKRFRDRLKAQNPHALVIAEEWESVHSQLHDGLYDGVLNFQFRRPLVDFFRAEISAETFVRRLSAYIEGYPPASLRHCWNLLGNHDMERFYGAHAKDARQMRLAVALQTLLPGTPHLYYGDEIGMKGRDSHEARAPMVWQRTRWDREVFAAHHHFLSLRRDHPVLAEGDFRWLGASNRGRTLSFVRRTHEEEVLVLVNAGHVPQAISALGGTYEVPPQDVRVKFA